MYPKLISVIVTTYNWPQALELVLQSLAAQMCDIKYEVIVADDGSTADTKNIISKFKVKHAWQEDKGYRVSRCRNRALLQAQGDYIIFIDGDCMVRNDFIVSHYKLAEKGYFVFGNRVLLSEKFTKHVIKNNIGSGILYWLKNRLQGNCNRLLPLFSIPLGFLRKINPRKWQGAKGCNLAMWRCDLDKVNGWDMAYEGWGYEDSDLVIRLINVGVMRKSAKFKISVIHLWHKENDRSKQDLNWDKLNNTNKKILAEKGLRELVGDIT